MRDDITVFRVGQSTKVYLYRGHNPDGSVNGYGPCVFDGTKGRWRGMPRARFRCFPSTSTIITKGRWTHGEAQGA